MRYCTSQLQAHPARLLKLLGLFRLSKAWIFFRSAIKSSRLALAVACSITASLASQSIALPRVGIHTGYTRFVIDIPLQNKINHKLIGNTLKISLQKPLQTEQGTIISPSIVGYKISGKTVSIILKSSTLPKVKLLKKHNGSRLVVDIPSRYARAGQQAQVIPLRQKVVAPKPPTPPRPLASVSTRPSIMTASQGPQGRPTVVIDAGHGGRDPGMVSRYVMEKDVTLAIALYVRQFLNTKGVNVILTRDRDKHLSPNKRVDLNMRSRMAYSGKVSAFVSIHVNAGPSAVNGVETYYFGHPIGKNNRSLAVQENGGGSIGKELTAKASNLAKDMLGDILAQAKLNFSRQLAHKVQSHIIKKTGAASRGVRTDAFYVIWNTNTAAILTEVGFGSNPHEGKKLKDPSYQKRIAQGISNGLLDFLHMR